MHRLKCKNCGLAFGGDYCPDCEERPNTVESVLPCLLCNVKPRIGDNLAFPSADQDTVHYVHCDNCDTRSKKPTQAEAIRFWNAAHDPKNVLPLTSLEGIVYNALKSHMDKQCVTPFISVSDLCKELESSECIIGNCMPGGKTNVSKALSYLIDHRYIAQIGYERSDVNWWEDSTRQFLILK